MNNHFNADELVESWLVALRSGKYAQGQGRLRNEGFEPARYCCLGVLADVCYEKGICKDGWQTFDRFDWRTRWDLPDEVLTESGSVPYGVLRHELEAAGIRLTRLIYMNDTDELSFEQIANFIEEVWNEHRDSNQASN